MKAWRIYDFNDMRLDEIPVPEVKPGTVLFKLKVVQPSITEVLNFRDVDTLAHAKATEIIKEKAPVQLFGHEFSGVVTEVGKDVERFRPGDRVAARGTLPCFTCTLCQAGRSDECRKGPMVGWGSPGCFAEYGLLPETALVKLADGIDDNEGALIQTLSYCVAVGATANFIPGDTSVVLGMGSIGSLLVQVTRVLGAGVSIAVDVHDKPLELAHKLGADITINAEREDPVQKVLDITNGIGADVVFDCAGGRSKEGLSGTSTLHQALHMARDSGKIVEAAYIPNSEPIDLLRHQQRGVQLLFARGVTIRILEYTVQLVASGRIQLKPIISHVLHGLEKLPEAFEITGNKTKYGATSPAQIVV